MYFNNDDVNKGSYVASVQPWCEIILPGYLVKPLATRNCGDILCDLMLHSEKHLTWRHPLRERPGKAGQDEWSKTVKYGRKRRTHNQCTAGTVAIYILHYLMERAKKQMLKFSDCSGATK